MLDSKIFEQCKKNNGKAQRALYDHYRSVLMGICRRYTRTKDDAQDILQESFIKIFNKLHQVEDVGKLEGWVKSVVVRTAIDHYHKAKRIEMSAISTQEHHVPDVDYELILENLSDQYLIEAINGLPEGCRMVFNLFEVEGYAHSEIATMLGVSEGTSRSQLHHAKLLLKQKLSSIGVKRYEKFA